MSIRSVLANILAPSAIELPQTDKRNEVATSFFSSKRFLVVIALAVLIIMNLLPTTLFHDTALVVIAYIFGESLTKTATVVVNGWIKVHEVKTDIAYEKLNGERAGITRSGSVTVATAP